MVHMEDSVVTTPGGGVELTEVARMVTERDCAVVENTRSCVKIKSKLTNLIK